MTRQTICGPECRSGICISCRRKDTAALPVPRKEEKHIQINYYIPEILKQALEAEQKLEDEQIKKAIKEYRNQQEV